MNPKEFIEKADINQEKKEAILWDDSTMVVANPGTGKTLLLAYKYVYLLYQGVEPKDILCLTFTEKACQEMQERILKLIEKEKVKTDISQINIQTFHAFSLDNLEDSDIISSNLLRYEIYSYLIKNEVLNYSENYLLDKIVPKIENSIRYLKSFGITPDKLEIDKIKSKITKFKNFEKEELEKYLEHFVKIFDLYEKYKEKKGLDYTDLLINFSKLKTKPLFKWVLVDELQDVNDLEADIALSVGEKYLVVGDKKQAIFGFQGGSIGNFNKFNKAKEFILSNNFRSTDDILDYAKALYSSRTKEESNIRELKNLKNEKGIKGKKPTVVLAKDYRSAVCNYIKELEAQGKEIAVIARTNGKLVDISKQLDSLGISYSSTYLTSSDEARSNIICFIKGVLSKDINLIKSSMFTPFFPINLQDAFELSDSYDLTLEQIYARAPGYKDIRESINNINDLSLVFMRDILPIAVNYGKDYTLSCVNMQNATLEALEILENKTLENLCTFLESAEQLAEDVGVEKKVILTTVHKAKGRQFQVSIYIPSKPNDNENFQDAITTAILQSKNLNPKEELEEEATRIDFVAITRAKEELYIITDKVKDYAILEKSEHLEYNNPDTNSLDFNDINKKAFSLFINKDYENAKKLLENKDSWLIDYITKHFENLKHLSFSSIQTDPKLYLEQRILKLSNSNKALIKGSLVHSLIDKTLKGEEVDYSNQAKEIQEILDNAKALISEIKINYPETLTSEQKFKEIPLSKVTDLQDTEMTIKGTIDAIFRNPETGEYLIVDWKTDKNPDTSKSSEHRRQLELYKNIFSYTNDIPESKIKTYIGYVSKKKTINDGIIDKELDTRQPGKTAIATLSKHIQTLLDWKTDPTLYLAQLEAAIQKTPSTQTPLTRTIIQQYRIEQEKKQQK